MHWAARWRATKPPVVLFGCGSYRDAKVEGPHPQRVVVVTRFGPRELDPDNLVASVKPVVDRLRGEKLLWDDTSEYLQLRVRQEKAGRYDVVAEVYG